MGSAPAKRRPGTHRLGLFQIALIDAGSVLRSVQLALARQDEKEQDLFLGSRHVFPNPAGASGVVRIPVKWAADSGVMWAGIPLRCWPHFLFHRNRGSHRPKYLAG
jgi:hypothetical protein